MKMKFAALAAVAALSFGGMALAQETTPPAPAQTEQAAAPAVAPASPALPEGISAPPEGKGQVVFFRPNRFVGAALTFTVRENGADLGRLPNGRYFVQVADPGVHAYEIGRNDTIRMEIEPGVTYYAIQSTQMGIIAGRAVLSPSDQPAFETALPHMQVSAPIAPH